MERNLLRRPARRCAAPSIMVMVVGIGSLSVGAGLRAPDSGKALPLPELELAYWFCDYTASTRRVDMATAQACGSISDDLKNRKFGGDFDALLAWWRTNKDAMHRTIDTAARSARKEHAPVSGETVWP